MFLQSWAFVQGQDGGRTVYSFLEVPASARIAALGGTFISVKDHDVNGALQAASLLNPTMDKSLALSAVTLFGGARLGDATYVKSRPGYGTFMASMHYADYGTFQQTNVYGDVLNDFKAADYCLTLGWGYQYRPRFSIGAATKFIYSNYYLYQAAGMAIDLSATYEDTANNWTVTALFRNVGFQFDNYVKGQSELLPGEALIAMSKRLAHTPLRFNVTYRHLEKFDLSYTDPNELSDIDPLTGEASVEKISFTNNLSRHFIVGAEILLSKNFHLRAAYHFQRRQELAVDSRTATAGFSLGFGLKINRFVLSYGRAKFNLAGATNSFSVSTSLSDFCRGK
jgi:hypothetical protein